MSLWKRTRDLEAQVETLSGVVTDMADVVNALGRRVSNLEVLADALNTDRDDLAAKLGGQIDELEEQLRAATTTAESRGEREPEEKYPPASPEENARAAAAAQTIALEPGPELTDKQQALLAAVNELGEASTGDIARHVGRDGEGDAVSMALQKLKRMGVVGHNGRRAKGARWLALNTRANRLEDALSSPEPERYPPASPEDNARAAAEAQTIALEPAPHEPEPLTDLDERIIRLVSEHGPVTAMWVADQVVKNRRETAARMRELARGGLLVDLDGAFATPDLADAA